MIIINNRRIATTEPPYIIAELSANHNGSIDHAKSLIKAARVCGANAVKIQTYDADTMTIDSDNPDFTVIGGIWDKYKLYELYREAHTPFNWHQELFRYANELGITLFSTPFDESAVELLESFNTPAYKISSFELTDLPLIRCVAKKNKPILMSTGMASKEEIEEAIEAARSGGCNSLLLFHCISSYPSPINQANLRQILKLKQEFKVEVGLSDHTLGNLTAIAATALGASAIEKHFTISRHEKGPDSEFSSEPLEFQELVSQTKNVWEALGKEGFERPKAEEGSKAFRRSIYFIKDVLQGQKIDSTNIKRIRPGFGLPPKYFEVIMGKTINKNVQRGDRVTWDIINLDENDRK